MADPELLVILPDTLSVVEVIPMQVVAVEVPAIFGTVSAPSVYEPWLQIDGGNPYSHYNVLNKLEGGAP
jgi:hypothetical protein